MNSLKCNIQCDCLGKCNDISFRNSTVATEVSCSSATDSRRSLDTTNVHHTWEKDELELLLDDRSCKSDCSMLTSDHESTRNAARIDNDSMSPDSKKQQYSVEDPYALVYDDSFFHPCEVDVGSLGDESMKSNDELHCRTPMQRRGRSMSIDEHPRRSTKDDSGAWTPSKQNYLVKKCSMQVRRSSSLPPKEHANRTLEFPTNGNLSRFARSKRRTTSPRHIVNTHCPSDQRPHKIESKRIQNESEEKPNLRLPSVRTNTVVSHSHNKINKLESSRSVSCEFGGIPIRVNEQKLSRNCSLQNDGDTKVIFHRNNTTVQTPNYGDSCFERVQLHGAKMSLVQATEYKESQRRKGKILHRSHSLQSGDDHIQRSHLVDKVEVTSKQQSCRYVPSKENEFNSLSRGQVLKSRTNSRQATRVYSSWNDRTTRNTQVRDGTLVRTSEFHRNNPVHHDDQQHSVLYSRDRATSHVEANNLQGMKDFKGRKPSRNRSIQSGIEELNRCTKTISNVHVLHSRSSRRDSSSHEVREEKETVTQYGASHQSISPQTKDPFLRSINKAESLISTSTAFQNPLDEILPNTLDSRNDISLHGCKPHCQGPLEINAPLTQRDLDARWRVDAHGSSPRHPSQQLNESEQNSSRVCRTIMKHQSFPESPTRRSRTLNSSRDNFSTLVQCDTVHINKPRIYMQPDVGKNQASKASPLRRQSPVKPGSSVTHQRRRSNSIDALMQRQVGDPWNKTEPNLPGQRLSTQSSATSNNYSPTKALKCCNVDNFKNHCNSEQNESGHRYVEPAVLVKNNDASETVHKTLTKRSCDSNKRFL